MLVTRRNRIDHAGFSLRTSFSRCRIARRALSLSNSFSRSSFFLLRPCALASVLFVVFLPWSAAPHRFSKLTAGGTTQNACSTARPPFACSLSLPVLSARIACCMQIQRARKYHLSCVNRAICANFFHVSLSFLGHVCHKDSDVVQFAS